MAEMSGGTLNASLLDPTIALKAGAAPVFDPLATMGKVQALQSSILNNRLVGQQLQSKIMGGRALIGAIDPATGLPDQAKVGQFFVDHPDQAQFGAQAISDAQTLNTAQLANIGQNAENQRKQIGLSLDQGKILNASMLPVIHKFSTPGPDGKVPVPTSDDLQKAYADAITNMGPGLTQTALGRAMESIRDAGKDPAKILQAMKGAALTGNPTPETIGMVFGVPTPVSTGGGTVMASTPALGGPTELGTVIPNTLPPTTQVYNDQKKQMEFVGGAAGAPAGGGRLAAAAPLGVPEAENAAAQAGALQAQQWRLAADRVPDSQAALKNIRSTLDSFTPGPKANWLYAVKALAQQLGVAPPSVTEGVAGQEEFNKLATQFINQQVGALGGTGTDAKLESARHGTPNEFMSKEGIRNVTALMMGLNDATMVKNAAWQKWLDAGNSPGSAGKFQTAFNERYNPRVFQSVYMSDAQKANMLKGMTAPERERFQKDWVYAKKAGWLQ